MKLYLAIVLLAAATFSSCNQKSEEKPNIIVFIADDMGWEDSTPYGNDVIKTPTIQRLAEEGMLFENFYLTASSCSPSRSSILSGLYPHNTKAMKLHDDMPPEIVLFPELLKEVGYYTMLVGKNHGTRHPEVSSKFDKLVSGFKAGEMGVNWVSAIQNCPDDQPFFMWAAASDPHRPYKASDHEFNHDPQKVILPPYFPDVPEMRKELALYYDEISRFDHHVGMAMEELEKQGLLDNTFVILMSDNGKPFPQSKTRVNVQGLKSQFIVWYPKSIKAASKTLSLASAIDIAPTILEMAGTQKGSAMQGKSLLPILQSPETEIQDFVFGEHNWHDYKAFERVAINKEFVFSKNWLPEFTATPPADASSAPSFQVMQNMFNDGSLLPEYSDCFVSPRSNQELFQVTKDMHCMDNLAAKEDYKEEIAHLNEVLLQWQKETNDVFPGKENLKGDTFSRITGKPLENKNNQTSKIKNGG